MRIDKCIYNLNALRYNDGMKQVAIYLRVSTDKQNNGLEAQERALKEFCRLKGTEKLQIYQDNGVSGAKEKRQGLDALMRAANDGKIDTLIVYSFSRFARSTKHLISALEEFERLGIKFISLSENIDTGTAMGKAVFTILSAISQLERELIVERVKNGLKNAKAKGKKLGRSKTRNSNLIQELAKQKYSQRRIATLAGCSKTTVFRELLSKQGG